MGKYEELLAKKQQSGRLDTLEQLQLEKLERLKKAGMQDPGLNDTMPNYGSNQPKPQQEQPEVDPYQNFADFAHNQNEDPEMRRKRLMIKQNALKRIRGGM